jgi:hypothetical protein
VCVSVRVCVLRIHTVPTARRVATRRVRPVSTALSGTSQTDSACRGSCQPASPPASPAKPTSAWIDVTPVTPGQIDVPSLTAHAEAGAGRGGLHGAGLPDVSSPSTATARATATSPWVVAATLAPASNHGGHGACAVAAAGEAGVCAADGPCPESEAAKPLAFEVLSR